MDSYNPENVMIGTQGEIWIDGEYVAEVTAFKAQVKLNKEQVDQNKKMFTGYKVTSYEGSGTVKMNHVSSFFIKKMSANMKAAKQTKCEIIAKLDDPDAIGIERVVIKDATFDTLTLMDWSVKKLVEDSYDFTFTDYEILETAG